MKNKLPELSSLFFPALFTLRRGNSVHKDGISMEKIFEGVWIETSNLASFIDYIGFETKTPLSYLYVLAQRAQVGIMLDKQFPLAIPGMIHIENYLTKFGQYQPDKPFLLKASVHVEYKETGSLIPIFQVEIYQMENLVASCKSIYLVKRKSKNQKRKKKEEPEKNEVFSHRETWMLTRYSGREYAKVSGDKNLIHTSLLFARLFGFRSTIMHGWYSVCKIEQIIEKKFRMEISRIETKFQTPVLLPGNPTLILQNTNENNVQYLLLNDKNSSIHLQGIIEGNKYE
ncbi:MAG: MaoC/PaaZ C-terminal domain-containing protein [Cyclobacteriaceae bacterium]|nr:MaoC/PaaZ C-terminal domain-containing protein [Cyclobacteriaceae bacterium]